MTPEFFRRATRNPVTVYLACFPVKIRVKPKVWLDGSRVEAKHVTDKGAHTIEVEKGSLPAMRERLMHEAMHAACYVGGASWSYKHARDAKIEERVIRPVAPLLLQFLDQCK